MLLLFPFLSLLLRKNTLGNNQGYKVLAQYFYQLVISDKAFHEQYHLLSWNKDNTLASYLVL